MLLQEILDAVDSYIPNALHNPLKIGFINQIQRQLYRDYPVPEATYRFVTDGFNQLIVLPSDCAEDRITKVVMDEEDLPYIPLADSDQVSETEEFWTIVDGVMLINPSGTADRIAYVYYRPRAFELSEDNLGEAPTFPEDFHELLVFGCAKRVALALPVPDTTKIQVFDTEYHRLAEKADLVLRKPKQTQVRIHRAWR